MDRSDYIALATALTHRQVEEFLFFEADLLDTWRLHEWLTLFDADAMYVVPTTDLPQPVVGHDMTLIADTVPRLRSRVRQLLGGKAWAENPPSRTRRLIGNVRIADRVGEICRVHSNFAVHRFRHGRCDTFVGHYEHQLAVSESGIRIRHRQAVLDHEILSPHGMVSFIL